jgi:hypothetical protein
MSIELGDKKRGREGDGWEEAPPSKSRNTAGGDKVLAAIRSQKWAEILRLLEAGASPDEANGSGVLSALRRNAPVEVIRALVLAGGTLTYPSSVTMPGGPPLNIKNEDYPVFLPYDVGYGNSRPLVSYEPPGMLQVLRVLLSHGAPVRSRTLIQDGRSLLQAVVDHRGFRWISYPRTCVSLVDLLNKYGGGITQEDVRLVLYPNDARGFSQYRRISGGDQFLPLTVGVSGENDTPLGAFAQHPLYDRNVLPAIMRLAKNFERY